MKVVCYTVITGGYDILQNHINIPEYDFIAYIDDKSIIPPNTNWEIRDIPEELSNLPSKKKSSYIKFFANKYFPEYDVSIYYDGKCILTSDCKDLLALDYEDKRYILIKHPHRDCIYDEILTISNLKWEEKEKLNNLLTMIYNENYPKHNGYFDTCFMIRYHNDPYVIELMNAWWDLINELNMTRIDMCLRFVFWKQNKKYNTIPYYSKYFKNKGHYKQHYKF